MHTSHPLGLYLCCLLAVDVASEEQTVCAVVIRLTDPIIPEMLNLAEIELFDASGKIPPSQLAPTISSSRRYYPLSNCFDGG